ncbi:MAG: hypothetical protein RG741_08585 [Bacteroidales bacterium]|nr:hypothetical protein [Bacteroidales bacterium]
MAKKNVRGVLDELIRDSGKVRKEGDFDKIVSLGIPIIPIDETMVEVKLDDVVVFEGIEHIIVKLMDEVRESCFIGQTDVIAVAKVERETCPQLHDFGIHKILFYAAIETLEDLPLLNESIRDHIRYIFNALQSPAIYRGFFDKTGDEGLPSLLFPFGRDAADDSTGLQYLVEKVAASHFIRITVEKTGTSRLNYRKINHRVISELNLGNGSKHYDFNASVIYSSIINNCRNNKVSLKDTGLELGELLKDLKASGYNDIREFAVNWSRKVSAELLNPVNNDWRELVERMLITVNDIAVTHYLKKDITIRLVCGQAQAFLKLKQRGRSLQFDLGELVQTEGLEHYLGTLGMLKDYMNQNRNDLSDHHIIFIHHFTNETLATLCAFDQMNVSKTDTLWVKYFGSIPLGYMNTIMALPLAVYRFFGLQPVDPTDYNSGFLLSDTFSPLQGFELLSEHMRKNPPGFMESMQLVAMHIFLDAIVEAGGNRKVVIAEDGGYLAPLVNSLSLKRLTLGKVCELYRYPGDRIPHGSMNEIFSDWISRSYVGSVEHTRNGYDSLMDVEKLHGRLAFPACTLAISKYKVFDESIEVAYSCISAIENMLNGQGFVFNYRKCLVLGSLGAIGIQSMHALVHRLGKENVAGVDLARKPGTNYEWRQYTSPDELPEEISYTYDIIFGVIGRSILDAAYFEKMVLHTKCRNIFLASGSTKQYEFTDFIRWSNALLSAADPQIGGYPLRIDSEVFDDPQTSTVLGTRLNLALQMPQGEKHLSFFLLSQLMPVNFQYYGVARETMDRVMTDFVSLVSLVSLLPEKKLPARVLALDHDIDREGNTI